MKKNLKHALPLIAGALASKQGVKVLQGDWAKTNCVDTIWLPPLPDDENVTVKALGFVGHETGHIAFTDSSVIKLVEKQNQRQTFFGILNLLEDIRMEKLQKARFPGVSDNLDKLFKALVAEKVYTVPDEEEKPIKIMTHWMLNKLRYEILQQDAFKEIAEATHEVFEKTLPLNTRIRLEALAYDVDNAKSTMDVFSLTQSIMKMIEEEAENEKKKEEEQAAQQQAQPNDSNQTSGQSQSQSQSGDTNDDASDGGSNGSSQDDDDSDEGNASGNGAVGDSSNDQATMSEVLESIINADKSDQYQDIGDVLAEQINTIKKETSSAVFDGSGPMRVFNAVKHAQKGRNEQYDFEARRAVNALKLKLHTMLQSQTFNDSIRGDRGSRFSQRHLHEVKIGGKVFEKRTEGIDIDLAATLLIDISGSMNTNNKLKIAGLSGYATAEALSSVHGVSAAVAVFPTVSGVDYLTGFDTKPKSNAEAFNQLKTQGDTPLSDAMARASIDLLQQQKSRKLLFVITDGEPNFNDQSASVIESAINAGVEVMGVGIGVDLDHLFKTWCSIDSVEDLPRALFGMLQTKLVHKKAA